VVVLVVFAGLFFAAVVVARFAGARLALGFGATP